MPATRRTKRVAPKNIHKVLLSYARELRMCKVLFDDLYLFGSYAKGTPRTESDIDVAVVVKRLPKNYFERKAILWGATRRVDTRIEPVFVERRDLHSDTPNPIAHEVYTTGILIK